MVLKYFNEMKLIFDWIDPINLNVDSDSEENGETPFQRLIRLHASPSNYNDRFHISLSSSSSFNDQIWIEIEKMQWNIS